MIAVVVKIIYFLGFMIFAAIFTVGLCWWADRFQEWREKRAKG
jgi:hypothetical protein